MTFRKPKPMQAAVKLAVYGPAGSGKSFSALLFSEGLAQLSGKRTAFIDSERGIDFYTLAVPERLKHPEAFDHMDVMHTRSVTEAFRALQQLDPDQYDTIVVDSLSHLWESSMEAYSGKRTKNGGIPLHAWGAVKAPFKNMIRWLMNSPFHVILCGREGTAYAEDEESGELRATGPKMRCEGETPFEPNILVRMEATRNPKGPSVIRCIAEKDRTGLLQGQWIEWPSFESVILPVLKLLGADQAQLPSPGETRVTDVENLETQEAERLAKSQEILSDYAALFQLAKTPDEVAAVAKDLTPAVKAELVSAHLVELREAFRRAHDRAEKRVAAEPEPEPEPAGGAS